MPVEEFGIVGGTVLVGLEDGSVLMVNYSNWGDSRTKSHLYGAYFSPEDFRT